MRQHAYRARRNLNLDLDLDLDRFQAHTKAVPCLACTHECKGRLLQISGNRVVRA